jgi:hypothetical protein
MEIIEGTTQVHERILGQGFVEAAGAATAAPSDREGYLIS